MSKSNPMKHYDISELLLLMQYLRDPERGCPWDLKQTFKSIAASTIEEAYEVVDAIESEDLPHLKEELGDLLFQVVFYCQLGLEIGEFDFGSVVSTLTKKLISRHPHVFRDGELTLGNPSDQAQITQNENQVKESWESIKRQERLNRGMQGLLADIPVSLPGLTRAVKIQKRASQVGFDWASADQVLDELQEELDELRSAIDGGDMRHIEEEMGDLLFSAANMTRHLKLEPETVVRKANQKFIRRFQFIERQLTDRGQDLMATSPAEMEALWNLAKEREASS